MYSHEKYIKYYKSKLENHVVYVIKIDNKDVWKVGKTKKLQYRLYNLKQSLYEPFTIFKVLQCENATKSYVLENELKEALLSYRIRGEWFNLPETNMETIINSLV